MIWAIITGEYPPDPGGVGDYTRLVASGLAAAHDEVHVWAPASSVGDPEPGIHVHRLPGRFGPRALLELNTALNRLPKPRRILVQYVPHAFGLRAMNAPFCWWLRSRSEDCVWTMFHEVHFPLSRTQPLHHNVLGGVTRYMAGVVAKAADRIFVSIPAWGELLGKITARQRPFTWLPVPSNMPTAVNPELVQAVRREISADDQRIIGHFGTFNGLVAKLLREILPPLLAADKGRCALLLGRGAELFARDLAGAHPELRGSLIARGGLSPEQISAHLAASDVLVQPFPDGVSGRRASLMAGLALGLPIVTTEGFLTEDVWRCAQAVSLVPVGAPLAEFVGGTGQLLADPQRRSELGGRAQAFYNRRFALKHTLEQLRS